MQITEGGIAYIAEGSHIFLCPVRLIEGHSMAITIEDATIISTGIYSHMLTDLNVGIEAGVNVLCILGIINLDSEIVPVLSRANGKECLRQILKQIEGRLIALNHEVDVVVDTGAIESDILVALLALVIAEHIAHSVDHRAVAVFHDDAQNHLGTVVPHGTMLFGILPGNAHGVGSLVLPISRVVDYAQQVQVVERVGGAGSAVVFLPAPVLCYSAAHAVGQVFKRAAVLQMSLGNGTDEGAINKGIDTIRGDALSIHHHTNLLEVLLQARQRALYNELVGG